MIALAPLDHAIVVADFLEHGLEVAEAAGVGRGQHGFAIGDAIESVVAHHEFLRPARAADQRIAEIACAAQRGGDEIDPL